MGNKFNVKLKNLEIPLDVEELVILKENIDNILNNLYRNYSVVYIPYVPVTYTNNTTGTSADYKLTSNSSINIITT